MDLQTALLDFYSLRGFFIFKELFNHFKFVAFAVLHLVTTIHYISLHCYALSRRQYDGSNNQYDRDEWHGGGQY